MSDSSNETTQTPEQQADRLRQLAHEIQHSVFNRDAIAEGFRLVADMVAPAAPADGSNQTTA